MMSGRRYAVRGVTAVLVLMLGLPLTAAEPCAGIGEHETIPYTWRLRGGLAWFIGLRFPSSGVALFETSTSAMGTVTSSLRISASSDPGYYHYESEFDRAAKKTTKSRIDYRWGAKGRDEQTVFDYEKRLARVVRISDGETTKKVRQFSTDELRDVLTGIHSLRVLAPTLQSPHVAQIYSDGKFYPVLFRRGESKVLEVNGQNFACTEFLITAIPGSERRWPGGLRVWLTDDGRRLPVRIALVRGFATLDLTVSSLEECRPVTNGKLAR